MSSEADETGDRVPKGRSPSYPGIPLSTAIQRAETLYDYAQQHPIPLATITGRWGYKAPTTGPASVTYAALKKYGLLEDEGSGKERMGRLTDLAIEILNPNPGQQDAIRRSALTPPIHREWWEKYGKDLPPDDSLRWEYVVRGPFTENGFKDFLRVFRETVAFAKLDATGPNGREEPNGDVMTESVSADQHGDSSAENRRPAERGPHNAGTHGVMSYPIPVGAGANVVIEGRFPLTDTEWQQFLAVLNAMKPALTQPIPERRGDQATSEAME